MSACDLGSSLNTCAAIVKLADHHAFSILFSTCDLFHLNIQWARRFKHDEMMKATPLTSYSGLFARELSEQNI